MLNTYFNWIHLYYANPTSLQYYIFLISCIIFFILSAILAKKLNISSVENSILICIVNFICSGLITVVFAIIPFLLIAVGFFILWYKLAKYSYNKEHSVQKENIPLKKTDSALQEAEEEVESFLREDRSSL